MGEGPLICRTSIYAVRSAPYWSTLFYINTQAMHVALAADLTPYRAG
jgi:hypothetical protein